MTDRRPTVIGKSGKGRVPVLERTSSTEEGAVVSVFDVPERCWVMRQFVARAVEEDRDHHPSKLYPFIIY